MESKIVCPSVGRITISITSIWAIVTWDSECTKCTTINIGAIESICRDLLYKTSRNIDTNTEPRFYTGINVATEVNLIIS